MKMRNTHSMRGRCALMGLLAVGIGMTLAAASALAESLVINSATWNEDAAELDVSGTGTEGASVAVANAYNLGQIIGYDTVLDGKWRVTVGKLSPVPCRVYAAQTGGSAAELDVANAPADCAPQPPAPPPNQPPVGDAGGPYSGVARVAVSFDGSGSSDPDGSIVAYEWDFGDGDTGTGERPTHTYALAGNYAVSLKVTDDDGDTATADTSADIAENQPPTANDETFALDTAVVARDGQIEVPAPGVLLHDTDPDGDLLTAELYSGANGGSVVVNADGSFTYIPNANVPGTDSFMYRVTDVAGNTDVATVYLETTTGLEVKGVGQQNQFNILMNYELGMHCTGFEFAYCCVLPPYNSILAQVIKTDKGTNGEDFPKLLEGDPNENKDALGRETVLRDPAMDESGNFQKYVLRYWHEAQPRNDGRGKPQSSRLISAQELNSMFMWNTIYDVTARDPDTGSLVTGQREGYYNSYIGDGTFDEGGYANGWLNHLYIYDGNLEGEGKTGIDADKIHLGIDVPVPPDCGPALHPLGPVTNDYDADGNIIGTKDNDCAGFSKGNLLTFSGETGTIVYTQMKVLEDLPITLTSPGIWEALGLPLTPLEDTLDFFTDPGLVDEDSVRPFVAMKAQLHKYDPSSPQGVGEPVLDNGHPVIGFGTAPIDIPNCERCHSAFDTTNSPNTSGTWSAALVDEEIEFWKAYYGLDVAAGDSDWYPRLKGAAISILSLHDAQMGTDFTRCYPDSSAPGCEPIDAPIYQETRLGHESVICQKCHADNAIGAVTSASFDPDGSLTIRPITEAIHRKHRSLGQGGTMVFADSLGREGMCQGCHPAHRSDGNMDGYPITYGGDNAYAESDNRLGAGGCFVGRDVHSNPLKDIDGAETPEYLNVVGQWLRDNVARNQMEITGEEPDVRGIWCTNCHTQLSQEIWKAEDCNDLIRNDCVKNPRAATSLAELAQMIGSTEDTVISWMDPKDNINGFTPDGVDHTRDIWDPRFPDAMMAVIEVESDGTPVDSGYDATDERFSVNVLSLCTTADCVSAINNNKHDPSQWLHPENGALDGVVGFVDADANSGVAVPFSAADDARDHWLAPGEPHCADCHEAPYVEQSGHINAFAPYNYPRKAGLMRYSRGHRDITCQGCHESIHGLYPVAPSRELGVGFPGVDATSYAQAANLNADGSHGPLKCGACHAVNEHGVPSWFRTRNALADYVDDFDAAVGWQHEFTENADPRESMCLNCHDDYKSDVTPTNRQWQRHAERGRAPRNVMDQTEELQNGHIAGYKETSPGVWEPDAPTALDTVCRACHGESHAEDVSCGERDWKEHLVMGRANRDVWAAVSEFVAGSTCGW